MKVAVAYSPAARVVDACELVLPEGATVDAALAASGLLGRHAALSERPLVTGVWGRRCGLDEPLAEGDRVEVYRALQIDPKEARRLRGQRQQRRKKGR